MTARRRCMTAGAPYGRDSADNFGRRHRNKYAAEPAPVRAWCNAIGGDGYCELVADHPGPHAFRPGGRR